MYFKSVLYIFFIEALVTLFSYRISVGHEQKWRLLNYDGLIYKTVYKFRSQFLTYRNLIFLLRGNYIKNFACPAYEDPSLGEKIRTAPKADYADPVVSISSIEEQEFTNAKSSLHKLLYGYYLHRRVSVCAEPKFVNLLRCPGINSQPGEPVRQPYLAYRPAGYTVQTVDLILPPIGRIPQLHSCIEKNLML
jgi:hypothetical protein